MMSFLGLSLVFSQNSAISVLWTWACFQVLSHHIIHLSYRHTSRTLNYLHDPMNSLTPLICCTSLPKSPTPHIPCLYLSMCCVTRLCLQHTHLLILHREHRTDQSTVTTQAQLSEPMSFTGRLYREI